MPIKLLRLGAEPNSAAILAGADRLFASRSVEHLLLMVRTDAEDFVELAGALERIGEHGYRFHLLGPRGSLAPGDAGLEGLPPRGTVPVVLKARW